MKQITTQQVLASIYEQVNLAYLAKNYFGKSRSWLYHQLNGDAATNDICDIDRKQLKDALLDIANKITNTASML